MPFNDLVKVSIKSDKVTPFSGIFFVMDAFSSILGSTIDDSLGIRCKNYGYQFYYNREQDYWSMITLFQKHIYELTMNQFCIPSDLLRVFNTK